MGNMSKKAAKLVLNIIPEKNMKHIDKQLQNCPKTYRRSYYKYKATDDTVLSIIFMSELQTKSTFASYATAPFSSGFQSPSYHFRNPTEHSPTLGNVFLGVC